MRVVFALAAVLMLSAMVFFYGCEKDTRTITVTNTVTVSHYYYNVSLDNAEFGLHAYCCYNGDNGSDAALEHFGTISFGSMEVGAPWGNEMDFGFAVFDIGAVAEPENSQLTDITLYLNNYMPLENGMNVFVTLQDEPTDCAFEMIERICTGTLLAQVSVDNEGYFTVQIDPAAVTLHGGKLYLGFYSDVTYNDLKMIICDWATSYARVRYTAQE